MIYGYDRELKVSNYGTVYGDDLKEMPINKLLKKLKKLVNSKKYSDDDNECSINYLSFVKKNKENVYSFDIEGKPFILDISNAREYYLQMKEELDKLCEISSMHRSVIDNYDDFENNKDDYSSGDVKSYLNVLNGVLNRFNFLKYLSIFAFISAVFGIPIFIVLCLLFPNGLGLVLGFTFALFSVSVGLNHLFMLDQSESIFQYVIKYIRLSKIYKSKKKEYEKLLTKSNNLNAKTTLNLNKVDTGDKYKDAILNYMRVIMFGVEKLNRDDKLRLISELKDSLEEYTSRMKALNDDSEELSLEKSKRIIYMNTLDKLTGLEIEVARLLRKDNEDRSIETESEDLMREIDGIITSCESEGPTMKMKM